MDEVCGQRVTTMITINREIWKKKLRCAILKNWDKCRGVMNIDEQQCIGNSTQFSTRDDPEFIKNATQKYH